MRATWILVGCLACGDGGKDSPIVDAPPNIDAAPGSCGTTTPWASAPALPNGATQETAVVAVGDKVYVLGGFNGQSQIVPSVQIFDTTACTWTTGPNLPASLHHANAAVVDGTIYVLGTLQTLSFTATPDVWAWNPATDANWIAKQSMPGGSQRGSGVAGVIDGKIYLAGGFRNGQAVTDVSMYDPVANTWTGGLPALPAARDHACGGAIGGKLYVAGGRNASITSQAPNVYEFTPGAGWVEKAPMPTGRGGTACGVVGDRLVVVGGEGNSAVASGVFPQVEVVTTTTNTWASLEMMPTPRHGMGAAAIGTKVYVPGGADKQGFGAVATFEILTP